MLITKHQRLHSGVCYSVVVHQALLGDVGGPSYICNGITEDIFPKGTVFFSVAGSSVCTCPCTCLLMTAVC